MGSFIALLGTIFKLLPEIVAGITAIENAVPLPGQGAAKLDLLKGIVSDSYAAIENAQVPLVTVLKAVESIARRVVALYNGLGIFTKTPAPASPAGGTP